MTSTTLWIGELRQDATSWLTATHSLQRLADEYDARGGLAWIESGGERPDDPLSNEHIDALMLWVPFLVASITPEVKAALYAAGDAYNPPPTPPPAVFAVPPPEPAP